MNTSTNEPFETTGSDQYRTLCAQSSWQSEGGGPGHGSRVRSTGVAAAVPLLAGNMHFDCWDGLMASSKDEPQTASSGAASLLLLQGLGQRKKLEAVDFHPRGTAAVSQW